MSAVIAVAVCITVPQMSGSAQATDAGKCGSYYAYVSNGSLCVRRTTTGAAVKIVSPGQIFSVDSCVMDDTYIYYAAVNKSGSKTWLYRIKPNGEGKTKMVELTGKNTVLQSKCGNSLIYTYNSATSSKVHTRRYKLGGSRTYKVRNDMVGDQQSGQYVVGTSYTATFAPTSLYSVKGETGDWHRLSRSCVAYRVIDNTVYYVEADAASALSGTAVSVKACDLEGKNVRTLAQNVPGVDLEQAIPTEKALYYVQHGGGAVCRYSYANKSKKTLISDPGDQSIFLNYLGDRIVVQDLDGSNTSYTNSVYTIGRSASQAVKQQSLNSRYIFFATGKTYYAEKSQTGTVSLGRFS